MRYIHDKDNLKLLMNLLRDPSPNIRLEAFHLFKVCYIHMSRCVFSCMVRVMQLVHSFIMCTAVNHLGMVYHLGLVVN